MRESSIAGCCQPHCETLCTWQGTVQSLKAQKIIHLPLGKKNKDLCFILVQFLSFLIPKYGDICNQSEVVSETYLMCHRQTDFISPQLLLHQYKVQSHRVLDIQPQASQLLASLIYLFILFFNGLLSSKDEGFWDLGEKKLVP